LLLANNFVEVILGFSSKTLATDELGSNVPRLTTIDHRVFVALTSIESTCS